MRRPVTVEDVVREFSKFMGLWPPGYTDSPCPMIRKTVEGFFGQPAVDPELVKDALAAKARYCD